MLKVYVTLTRSSEQDDQPTTALTVFLNMSATSSVVRMILYPIWSMRVMAVEYGGGSSVVGRRGNRVGIVLVAAAEVSGVGLEEKSSGYSL